MPNIGGRVEPDPDGRADRHAVAHLLQSAGNNSGQFFGHNFHIFGDFDRISAIRPILCDFDQF
jgi:hypothetical protein